MEAALIWFTLADGDSIAVAPEHVRYIRPTEDGGTMGGWCLPARTGQRVSSGYLGTLADRNDAQLARARLNDDRELLDRVRSGLVHDRRGHAGVVATAGVGGRHRIAQAHGRAECLDLPRIRRVDGRPFAEVSERLQLV